MNIATRIRLGGLVVVDPLPAVLDGRWSRREKVRVRRRFPGCVIVRHRFGGRSARKG